MIFAADSTFVASALFTDEAILTREETFNKHNAHTWALANLHGTVLSATQRRFSINV